MNSKLIIFVIIISLVVDGASFLGGIKYQENKSSGSGFKGQFQGSKQNGSGGQGRFGNMGAVIIGEIISRDDKSITIKLADASSKIILLPDTVSVSKTDTGSKADLKNGEKVGVFGTDNSDGSVTAQNIQLNPQFKMGQSTRSGFLK